LQRDVSFPALDRADVGPVQPGFVGQCLLSQTARLASRANFLAELLCFLRHPATMRYLLIMSLQTISSIPWCRVVERRGRMLAGAVTPLAS
jgi:hypothetical protein